MAKRIVVIGGGVIGMTAAEHCSRRGDRVVVLEHAPERRGSSLGNAGMIVPSHFIPLAAPGMVALGLKWMWNPESPFYIKPRFSLDLANWAFHFMRASTAARVSAAAPVLRDLHMASRETFARLAAEEEFGLVQKGLLMLCKTQHMLDDEAVTAARAVELGVPAQVLDSKATAALDPHVTMDVAGSVYFPKDCHLAPERYLAAIENRLKASGGEIKGGVKVTGWSRDGRRINAVQTSEGEIEGDEFLLAGGAWSAEIVEGLGLRLLLQAGKGYSLTVPTPVELPQICAILAEARVAVTPMGGSLRFGGTMELAGLNETIDPRRVAGIRKAVPQYYPRFQPEQLQGVEPWRGLRPCSPDGMPYLGRTKAVENLVIATGHGMMGLSLAPVTGEIASQLLHREPARFDLRLLDPDRFA